MQQDGADVQVRKSAIRVDADVDDVTTAPALTECEHDTLALERVHFTIILRAVLVVVLELCERRFDSVCVNMFSPGQRVHVPSLRTAHHAALVHLVATAPGKLDSREGYWHWWCVLLESFELTSYSMPKDMMVLMRKDLQQLSCLDSYWYWSVLAESTILDSENLPKWSWTLMNARSSHFLGFIGTIENPTLASAILNERVVGCGGGARPDLHVDLRDEKAA